MSGAMTENKQKLIALVSALEEENIVAYCYTFIGLKVYGKAKLPENITAELRQMWEEHFNLPHEDGEQPEPEEMTADEKAVRQMNKQRDKFREEYNEDLKRKIRIAIDRIGGYAREEMFTLEFVYGAVKKYIPENGKAGHEEHLQGKVD